MALATHGALYLAVKTEGELQARARAFVHRLWIVLFGITIISLVATIAVRSDTLTNYYLYPVAFVIPVAVLASLGGMLYFCRRNADRKAFASSCVYLVTMMVGAARVAIPSPALLKRLSGPRRSPRGLGKTVAFHDGTAFQTAVSQDSEALTPTMRVGT